jgi:hypothetical protein
METYFVCTCHVMVRLGDVHLTVAGGPVWRSVWQDPVA